MFDITNAPEQVIGHKVDTISSFDMTDRGYAIIPEAAVINRFQLSPDVSATMVMKNRPYSDKDGMLIVQQTGDERIESIEGLYPTELHNLLIGAGKASEVGLPDNGIQFISINSHRSDSYGYVDTKHGRKSRAQTLRDLHVHFGVIEPESILPLESPLTKHELDIVYDPMASVVERLLSIPSIKNELFKGLSLEYEGVKQGNIRLGRVAIENPDLSRGLIAFQERLRTLYESLYNCFYDGGEMLNQDRRLGNIESFFDEVRNENDDSSLGPIEKLRGYFVWLSTNLKEKPEASDRMFLEGFASTTAFIKNKGEESWNLIVAPRIISTGNALHALGLVKRLTDSTPEFKAMRKDYIAELKTLYS